MGICDRETPYGDPVVGARLSQIVHKDLSTILEVDINISCTQRMTRAVIDNKFSVLQHLNLTRSTHRISVEVNIAICCLKIIDDNLPEGVVTESIRHHTF